MNFKEAFKYMFADKTFYKNYFILFILILISNLQYISIVSGFSKIAILFTFIISIFSGMLSYGYMYLAIKNHNLNLEKVLPDFINNFKMILKTGAKAVVSILLAVLIIFVPVIVISFIIFSILGVLGILMKQGHHAALGILVLITAILFLLFLLLFVLFYIYWIISTAAMMINFVDTGSFWSFINLKKSNKIIKTDVMSYAKICLFYLILSVLGFILYKGFGLYSNPSKLAAYLYSFISAFIGSYFMFVFISLIGQFYKKYISLQNLDNCVEEEK